MLHNILIFFYTLHYIDVSLNNNSPTKTRLMISFYHSQCNLRMQNKLTKQPKNIKPDIPQTLQQVAIPFKMLANS